MASVLVKRTSLPVTIVQSHPGQVERVWSATGVPGDDSTNVVINTVVVLIGITDHTPQLLHEHTLH
eukprot:m.279503 g.279503  ORF g.279503 m.279503 type:complete len:66 (+) comp26967_c1_seq4:2338-2535(+)